MARNCNRLWVDALKIFKTSKTEYHTLNFFIYSGTCIPACDFKKKIEQLLSNKFTCLRADLVNQRQGVLHSN